jgi:hypothetical protein
MARGYRAAATFTGVMPRDGHHGIFFASWQVASIDLTDG